MPQQYVILTIFLVAAVVVAAAFIVFGMLARKGPGDWHEIHDTGYRIRRYWFVALLVIVVGGLGATLPHMPFPMTQKPSASTPVDSVHVEAMQYAFLFGRGPGEPDEGTVEVKAHQHIRFEVTSIDVNHDFVIEDSEGNIVAQVQAMPQETNSLYIVFDKPGLYSIRCGELCGLHHADMYQPDAIEVKA